MMDANELKQASFRGVAFDCRVIGGSVGRRTIIHEFPGLDEVGYDDAGQAPDRRRYEAVISGDDWKVRYLTLLNVLKISGPGELITPEGFRLHVIVDEPSDHSIVSVGEATITMSFVEVPEEDPVVQPDPATAVAAKSQTVLERARASIVTGMKVAGQKASVATAALDQATAKVDKVLDTVRLLAPPDEILDTLAALNLLRGTVRALIRSPGDLADQWAAVFESLSDPGALTVIVDYFGSSVAASSDVLSEALVTGTVADQVIAQNALTQDLMIWTTGLSALANSVANTQYAVFDDAQAAVNSVTSRLLAAESYVDSQTYLAMVALRCTLSESVLVVAQGLPRLVAFTPWAATSTMEIAQLLYQDGARAAEIAERNGCQHPGFVPAGAPMWVVT